MLIWKLTVLCTVAFGQCNAKTTVYVKGVDGMPASGKILTDNRSEIDCARFCSRNPHCLLFFFKAEVQECYYFNDTLQVANNSEQHAELLLNVYQKYTMELNCDEETQLALPSTRKRNSNCYNVTDTATEPTTETDTEAITTTSRMTTADLSTRCQSPYFFDVGSGVCYHIPSTKTTFSAGQAQCAADGGHLLRIDSPDVWTSITAVLDLPQYASMNLFFIDGTEIGHIGTWKNSDNTITWTTWAPGEPNGNDQNCIAMGRGYSFKYVDLYCAAQENLICQLD